MKIPNKNLFAVRDWDTNKILATIWDTSKYKTMPSHFSGNMSEYNLSEDSSTVLKEKVMGSKKKASNAGLLESKVLFTRASVGDVGGTVTLSRLLDAGFYIGDLGRGDFVSLVLYDNDKYFQATGKINRVYGNSGTLYINSWPKGLRKPSVGRARKIDVVDVSKIEI